MYEEEPTIEELRYANRKLGRMLTDRDKKDKKIAYWWFVIGICTGLLIDIFI